MYDDGWYEQAGLSIAADLLDRHPLLALVNARILVGPQRSAGPDLCGDGRQSPPPPRRPEGTPLLGFIAGAVVVRKSAYLEGGYDPRFFIGGEEETLSFRLAQAGWQMQYVPRRSSTIGPAWPT